MRNIYSFLCHRFTTRFATGIYFARDRTSKPPYTPLTWHRFFAENRACQVIVIFLQKNACQTRPPFI
ncbi:hypothetical protein TH25_13835 [Thalassospira profundimaris]|uniref:Uncharacterized protein n=1 Tax=Thalassospira profundimaris TaxID=502049 RepID=A0A367X4W6_9PROT|nr:hypothetical protein TH25_13835 [Thalassospira profundimaris]